MADQPSFPIPPSAQADDTTGRYIVTFRDDSVTEGLSSLRNETSITDLPSASDFSASALDFNQLDTSGGAIFPTLGVAVVTLDDASLNRISALDESSSAILSIEPERIYYALDAGGLPLNYLRGYRDAVNNLYDHAEQGITEERIEAAAIFADDAQSTWGLKATKAINSPYTGQGIRVAVLDTGLDLQHPDFAGRSITSQSFVPGQTVQDVLGHGTHCIGTSAGYRDANGRRYGIAYRSNIYVGKVLNNAGSGATAWILAGMEWAVVNQCHVISMSLGNTTPTPSPAFEAAGRRALLNGSLIIAAAGNNGATGGTVGQPANSPSIIAVAALDNQIRRASFSAVSSASVGANVDIAGPGVAVYSSVPLPGRYALYNGTSMATPHVAGIAALWAQAQNARSWQLWSLLTSFAQRLPLSSIDAGSGLVQAPV